MISLLRFFIIIMFMFCNLTWFFYLDSPDVVVEVRQSVYIVIGNLFIFEMKAFSSLVQVWVRLSTFIWSESFSLAGLFLLISDWLEFQWVLFEN